MPSEPLSIGADRLLSINDLTDVARRNRPASLAREALRRMKASHALIARYVERHVPVYGLTTQFGNQAHLLDPYIQKKKGKSDENYLSSLAARQEHLVASHDCGLGEEMPVEAVRAAMLLRAHCLGRGYSGVRPMVPEALLKLLDKQIHPIVHRYGSIGASGDLIPLSGIAAALLALDVPVVVRGARVPAKTALAKAKIAPLVLEGREGLALINGTSFSTGLAALALFDLRNAFPQMLSTIGFALEGLQIMGSGYEPIVHVLKRHRGEIEVSAFLKKLWKGSALIRDLESVRKETYRYNGNHGSGEEKLLQDYYSLRSVPQGFGPMAENLERAAAWIEEEMNSVNDNPIVDAKAGKIYHGANFMGHYVTAAADILKMDIAQASTWLHAILANLVHPRKNFGLPANLVAHPETDNGFRPLQILAASLAVQNRKLAQSQQAFMISTEGDNQDVNSLSAHAAFDLREATANLERLSAIVLMAAMQALELRGIARASTRARAAHAKIRKEIPFMASDRITRGDIEHMVHLIRSVVLY